MTENQQVGGTMDISTREDVNVLWDLLDTLRRLRLLSFDIESMQVDTQCLDKIAVNFIPLISHGED